MSKNTWEGGSEGEVETAETVGERNRATGFAKGSRGVQAAVDKWNRYWGKQEIFHVSILGIQRQIFSWVGISQEFFPFISITASSSHTSDSDQLQIVPDGLILNCSDEQLLGETKLPLSHRSYFPTSKLNKVRTWAELARVWDCWPIPDTAVGQDCCQRVAEQDQCGCWR